MKVLIVASNLRSVTLFRGDLVRDMVARGHRVLVLAPEGTEGDARELERCGAKWEPLPVENRSLGPFGMLLMFLRIVVALERESPRVVFAYTVKPVVFGMLAARMMGVARRCALISGLGHAFSGGGRFLRSAALVGYGLSLKGAHSVVFQNEDDRRTLEAERVVTPTARVVVVPGSGVNLGRYSVSDLPSPPLRFIMVSRLLRQKGVCEYAAAARMVKSGRPEISFILAGPMIDGVDGVTRGEVGKWVEDGIIDYRGEVEDIRPLLTQAHVCVLPSYYGEGVPRSLLEAMAMGRAIITTDHPGCRETVVEGGNGILVPCRDAPALADAMERFVNEPGMVSSMGRRGREVAVERFDVRAVNEVMLREMGL